jgi:hypothetical protein
MTQIAAIIQRLQTLRPTITDPAELARVDAMILKMGNDWQTLAQKLAASTHPLQAALQTWANSFGTTMEQIAKTIEETVGAALQSLNTWITTGKFNLQSFMQQIEQLGLKLVEQFIIQRVMAAINADAAATLAATLGPTIAGEMAGAATAMTIATAGSAALAAPAEVGTALLAIQGLLIGGSKHAGGEIERWHTGGLAEDERLIVAQTGEIMIRRDVAQENRDFLLALNAGYRTASTAHLGLRDLLIARAGWGTTRHGHRGGIGGASIGGAPPGTFYGGFFGSGGGGEGGGFGPRFFLRHSGGEIGSYHNGGMIGAGLGSGVHIYAFTDMNSLVKHMASRSGQKIIFDTVKGNRINLGIG